jgi:transposase
MAPPLRTSDANATSPVHLEPQPPQMRRPWVWKRVFEHLADAADNEYAMIDSTIVRAHQHSAGATKKTATKRSGAAAVA